MFVDTYMSRDVVVDVDIYRLDELPDDIAEGHTYACHNSESRCCHRGDWNRRHRQTTHLTSTSNNGNDKQNTNGGDRDDQTHQTRLYYLYLIQNLIGIETWSMDEFYIYAIFTLFTLVSIVRRYRQ